MVVISLVIWACASGGGLDCVKVRARPTDGHALTATECLMTGSAGVAQWARDNPGYEVKRWGCEAEDLGAEGRLGRRT